MEYLVIVKLNTGANLLFKGEFDNPCKAIREALMQTKPSQDGIITGTEVIQIFDGIKEI